MMELEKEKTVRHFDRCVLLASLLLMLSGCGEKEVGREKERFAPTDAAVLVFAESAVPPSCLVFSHLLITIPTRLSEQSISSRITAYGKQEGADYVLIGMSRQSDRNPDSILFNDYGPEVPYDFAADWAGWNFGFDEWYGQGPLVGFEPDQIDADEPAFATTVMTQAALLRCRPQ
jgi:hypothetical protein